MKKYGLIGKQLTHSFSKEYFTNKFTELSINSSYELFELQSISDFESLKIKKDLKGLNVTIPYKESIVPFLDEVDSIATEIGAVNTIKFENDRILGFNSDYYGFKESLKNFVSDFSDINALVLGTGGASKAVQKALKDLCIDFTLVSRNLGGNFLSYDDLSDSVITENKLILNTTPLGMYPNVKDFPKINYNCITSEHFCFDLIYNPKTSLFLLKSQEMKAKIKNGLEMLHLQAEKSWEIWNS